MTENKLITDVFVEGARKGWDIAVKNGLCHHPHLKSIWRA